MAVSTPPAGPLAPSRPPAEPLARPTLDATGPHRLPLEIAEHRCKGCGLCVAACPPHVLELDVGRVNALGYHPVQLIDPAGCTSCARCARVCPDAVFTVFAPAREA